MHGQAQILLRVSLDELSHLTNRKTVSLSEASGEMIADAMSVAVSSALRAFKSDLDGSVLVAMIYLLIVFDSKIRGG